MDLESVARVEPVEVVSPRDRAVRETVEHEVPGAFRLATWILGDPASAEDAVAEAALRAWERRRSLRDPDSAAAWFSAILVNVCRDALRGRSRARAAGLAPWSAPDSGPHAAERVAEDPGARLGERDELDRALARLTADERILLALRYGDDLSVPEVARRLGRREGTVKSRLHTALQHLRAAVEAGRREPEVRR